MMTRKLVTIFLLVLMTTCGVATANEWELGLSAGSKSISANVHYKSYMPSGYLRVGGSGIYQDDDPVEYKLGSLDFTVGSDTLWPGLTVDVGLRGLLGDSKEGRFSGNIGALGFTSGVGYFAPIPGIPIAGELFSRITWAPDPLSFMDLESFLEFSVGAGLRIMRNASIVCSFSAYRIDMTDGPGRWEIREDIWRLGIVLRF